MCRSSLAPRGRSSQVMTSDLSRSEQTLKSRAKSPEVSFVTCWGHFRHLGPFEVGADLEVTCQVSGGEFVTCWGHDLGPFEVEADLEVTCQVSGGEFFVTCWGHVFRSPEVKICYVSGLWSWVLSRVRSPELSFVTCQVSGVELCHVSGLRRWVLWCVRSRELNLDFSSVRSPELSFVTCQVSGVEFCHMSSLRTWVLSRVRSPELSFVTCQVSGVEFCHVSGLRSWVSHVKPPKMDFSHESDEDLGTYWSGGLTWRSIRSC